MNNGLEKWWPSEPSESGISGTIEFKSFEQAFQVLIKGSSIESVTFRHTWYSDWSWIASENRDEIFFSAMDEKLNDDCICEIIKYLNIPYCVYFASINERFRAIILKELSRDLRISPSSVGTIGLINFRYLLETFGNSVINLSVTLTSFPSTLGFYFSHVKTYILVIIYKCTGPNLKNINLYDFNLNERERKNVNDILQLFSQRGIKIKWSSFQ